MYLPEDLTISGSVAAMPEPGTMLTLAGGALVLLLRRKRGDCQNAKFVARGIQAIDDRCGSLPHPHRMSADTASKKGNEKELPETSMAKFRADWHSPMSEVIQARERDGTG